MKRILRILLISLGFIMMTGCQSAETNTTRVPAATVASKPLPPTMTQTPIATAEVEIKILLSFGQFGGDGVDPIVTYYGVGAPDFILYTDGRLLLKRGASALSKTSNDGYFYVQSSLQEPEICRLFLELEATNYQSFLSTNSTDSLSNPYYDFETFDEFSEGASDYILRVAYPVEGQINVYSSYVDYLIPEIEQAFALIQNYPIDDGRFKPYVPEQAILKIEAVDEMPEGNNMRQWPNNLPGLAELHSPVHQEDFGFDAAELDDQVDVVAELFNHQMKPLYFDEDGQVYSIVYRPVLPTLTFSDKQIELEYCKR
ncbi:MAG: hypothetical protein AAF902_25980 [Chloroflexota bacterium]